MSILSPDAIQPDEDQYCRRLLDPWVLSSQPRSSLAWSWIRSRDAGHWGRKILKRSLRSLISKGVLPVSAYRTEAHVRRTYDRTWSQVPWPRPGDASLGVTPAEWRDEGLLIGKGGLNFMELDRLMAAVRILMPRTVLEVGAGMGSNLFAMAAAFPDSRFTGLELTDRGVDRARGVQASTTCPKFIEDLSPAPIADPTAFRRIDFQQGNAAAMPFADKSFDLVFTRLALEQMELLRDQVLAEIRRVARRGFLCVEPFAEFNNNPHRRLAQKAKNYLSLPVEALPAHGLLPKLVFADWPQKLHEGVGLVYCEVA